MVQTLQHTQTAALQSAITSAIPRLIEEGRKVQTVAVKVDDRSGSKQTGYISPESVRSILVDIAVSARQKLPETFMLFLPKEGAPMMRPEALDSLIFHLRNFALDL
jgi:hypothetical protein